LLDSASPVTILVFSVPLLLVSAVGLFLGAFGKRWGTVGLFVLTVVSIVLAGGVVALVFALDGWPAVFEWWGGQSGVALAVGWTLIPTALALGGGWLALRRAVP
jgi:hypothetical protein